MPSNKRLPFLLLFAAALALPAQAKWKGYSALHETDDFRAASKVRVFKHEIREPWTSARLKVDLRVQEGEVTLRLIDGEGKTRLEKVITAGNASIDETFSGRGVWKVELRFQRATGNYAIGLIGVE